MFFKIKALSASDFLSKLDSNGSWLISHKILESTSGDIMTKPLHRLSVDIIAKAHGFAKRTLATATKIGG